MNSKQQVCLFVGRFQPFHNGHAAAVIHISQYYERLVIGISQAHISHVVTDPFTGGERYQMIKSFLESERLMSRADIIPIPIDATPTTWVPIIRSISPPFNIIYARSPLTQSLFQYWGYEVVKNLHSGNLLSATEVRGAISSRENWSELVPESVASVIRNIDGIYRVKQMLLGENHRLGG